MAEKTLKDVVAERGRSFRNAAEAYHHLTGETLSETEAVERLWYQRLRNRMVAARKRSGRNQGEIANVMGSSQSEVSRLENSLGPGTRLGTLRSYLAAFGSSLEGLVGSVEARPDAARSDSEEIWMGSSRAEAATSNPVVFGDVVGGLTQTRIVIKGEEFSGIEAVGIRESLEAFNNILLRSGMSRAKRRRFILAALSELCRVGRGSPTGIAGGFEVFVGNPSRASEKPLGPTERGEKADRPAIDTAAEFRETIAKPLKLSDF